MFLRAAGKHVGIPRFKTTGFLFEGGYLRSAMRGDHEFFCTTVFCEQELGHQIWRGLKGLSYASYATGIKLKVDLSSEKKLLKVEGPSISCLLAKGKT